MGHNSGWAAQAKLGKVGDIGFKQAMQAKWVALDKSGGAPVIKRKVSGSDPKHAKAVPLAPMSQQSGSQQRSLSLCRACYHSLSMSQSIVTGAGRSARPEQGMPGTVLAEALF